MARSASTCSSRSSCSSPCCPTSATSSTYSASTTSSRICYCQEGEKEDRIVQYAVPEWFLAHNVKTPAELQAAQPALRFCDEEAPQSCYYEEEDGQEEVEEQAHEPQQQHQRPRPQRAGRSWYDDSNDDDDDIHDEDGSEQRSSFRVSRDLFAQVRDTTAAALLRGGPRGRLSLATRGVVLRSSAKRGGAFLDEMVLHLAKDMGVTLISLGVEDLEDLGWEFDSQERESAPLTGDIEEALQEEQALEQPDRDAFMGPALHYFAADDQKTATPEAWDRHKRAFAAVLDAPKQKLDTKPLAADLDAIKGEPAATPEEDNKPVLVYLRDTKRLLDLDTDCKLLDRLQERVELRRRAGQAVALVIGLAHAGLPDEDAVGSLDRPWLPCHCSCWICEDCNGHGCRTRTCEPEQIKSRLLAEKTPILTLAPSSPISRGEGGQYRGWGAAERGRTRTRTRRGAIGGGREDDAPLPAEVNLRRLQRTLRLLTPQHFTDPDALLPPQHSWARALLGNGGETTGTTALGASDDGSPLWSKAEVDRAAAQVAGRAWNLPRGLGLRDVAAVLRRMHLLTGEDPPALREEEQEEAEEAREREEVCKAKIEVHDDGGKSQRAAAWRRRIRAVRAQCNQHEEDLLSCVINPDDLETTYDDVILDSGTKEAIKLLVSSRPETATTTTATLNNINNTTTTASPHHRLLAQAQGAIRGALLYGPPGTGKTQLARAVAREAGTRVAGGGKEATTTTAVLAVDCAALASQWVGETEKHIRAAFTLAAKLSPCVLFVDEADALFYHRRLRDRGWERGAVAQFLTEMDGLARRHLPSSHTEAPPFVMVATNRPMDLDEAFLRRLPQRIPLGLPDRPARAQLLRRFLRDDDLDAAVNLDALALVTEGYSGSDLRSLCAEAALLWAVEQQQQTSNNNSNSKTDVNDPTKLPPQQRLAKTHFARALQKIRPTVSKTSLLELSKFTQRFAPGARGGGSALPVRRATAAAGQR